MFPSHYKQWNNSRLNGIKKYIGTDIFKNIEVLDLGTGDGFFGQWCNSVGSNVTCVDIRKEYLDMIKKKIPKSEQCQLIVMDQLILVNLI